MQLHGAEGICRASLSLFRSILFPSRASADAGYRGCCRGHPSCADVGGSQDASLRRREFSFPPLCPLFLRLFRVSFPGRSRLLSSHSSSDQMLTLLASLSLPLFLPPLERNRVLTRSTSTNSAAPSLSAFPPSRPATSASSRRRRRGGGSRSFELTSTMSEENKDFGIQVKA
jgi:hypothetical protein